MGKPYRARSSLYAMIALSVLAGLLWVRASGCHWHWHDSHRGTGFAHLRVESATVQTVPGIVSTFADVDFSNASPAINLLVTEMEEGGGVILLDADGLRFRLRVRESSWFACETVVVLDVEQLPQERPRAWIDPRLLRLKVRERLKPVQLDDFPLIPIAYALEPLTLRLEVSNAPFPAKTNVVLNDGFFPWEEYRVGFYVNEEAIPKGHFFYANQVLIGHRSGLRVQFVGADIDKPLDDCEPLELRPGMPVTAKPSFYADFIAEASFDVYLTVPEQNVSHRITFVLRHDDGQRSHY